MVHQSLPATIHVRQARSNEIERVKAFYRETSYGGGVSPTDQILVAEQGDELVGAVRLCQEFGTVVLRGMRVRETFQRQGIGTAMLQAGEELIDQRICYCIPYRHLRAFYAQSGFIEIPAAEAPKGLQKRLADYRARGLDVVLVRRAGSE